MLLAGCGTPRTALIGFRAPYRPDNIFHAGAKPDKYFTGRDRLPGYVKRVAVLPLACDVRRRDLAAECDMLQPILLAEMIKTKKIEAVEVAPDELWRLTGRTRWTGGEILPADFLDALKQECGCEAVLFCQLTEFRAYPPLAVGWRLKLVDVRTQKTIWAGDEYFDAGKPEVLAAARHYQQNDQRQPGFRPGVNNGYSPEGNHTADWLAANSPRWFGQYSIASLFDTLPDR